MRITDVAVATITWARSPEDEVLLAQSLQSLAAAGLPVAVANREERPTFTAFLGGLAPFRICTASEQGLVPQIQASVETAATFGRRFILYVEPDKEFFFAHRMREFLERVLDDDRLGVALASRSAESFASFPPMQRYTEGVINQLCEDVLGRAGDYSYGPFVMNRALVPHVASLDRYIGWGWRHSTFVAACRAGLDVRHISGDYPCPSDQQHEDDRERMHRMRQLSQNLLGLLHVNGTLIA
jgi:hypothetical protein